MHITQNLRHQKHYESNLSVELEIPVKCVNTTAVEQLQRVPDPYVSVIVPSDARFSSRCAQGSDMRNGVGISHAGVPH